MLHRPDGQEAWFRAEEILYIGPADKKVWGSNAGSIVMIHDKWIAVRESVEDVRKKVEDK